MFGTFLDSDDARRAAEVISRLSANGFRTGALTGGVAIEAQLIAHGYPAQRRPLNDLDFVVEDFASIPAALADGFLVHHVHADAPPGKLLLQLIDKDRALRIDLFRVIGATLSRTDTLYRPAEPIRVVSIDDLAARTTSHVYSKLRRNRPVEVKHAQTFSRLAGFDRFTKIEAAWRDHHEGPEESFLEACEKAHHLLTIHQELLFRVQYSDVVIPCGQCKDERRFQRAEPAIIVKSLGYW